MNYVLPDKSKAVLFVYQTGNDSNGKNFSVAPMGLDPNRNYTLEEVNTAKPICPLNGKTISGKDLMDKGISLPLSTTLDSVVILLELVND